MSHSVRLFILRRVLNIVDHVRQRVSNALREYDIQSQARTNSGFGWIYPIDNYFSEGQAQNTIRNSGLGDQRGHSQGQALINDPYLDIANAKCFATANYDLINHHNSSQKANLDLATPSKQEAVQ